MRDRSKAQQLEGFESGWGPRELRRIYAPASLPSNQFPVRVICVRHGELCSYIFLLTTRLPGTHIS